MLFLSFFLSGKGDMSCCNPTRPHIPLLRANGNDSNVSLPTGLMRRLPPFRARGDDIRGS